jgi:hypothetical protein
VNKFDKMFETGNRAQLVQMEANDDKSGWDNIDILYANRRIGEIAENMSWTHDTDYEELINKAANIANFAHMIILKCKNEM